MTKDEAQRSIRTFYEVVNIAAEKSYRSAKMLETTLEKIAETILSLDEASLASLWEKYKNRMERFDISKDWEKAVIVFFIINAVRVKNHIFNEQVLKLQEKKAAENKNPHGKPNLRLVK